MFAVIDPQSALALCLLLLAILIVLAHVVLLGILESRETARSLAKRAAQLAAAPEQARPIKYFVYWDYGQCNDGSHSSGLQEFADLNAAKRCYGEELRPAEVEDGGVFLIAGRVVCSNHDCLLAPPGWQCTRERGHDGPCAAEPLQEVRS